MISQALLMAKILQIGMLRVVSLSEYAFAGGFQYNWLIIISMKSNKFQEIISSAISRLKPLLSGPELQAFDQMLSQLPKKIKEFNAQPYLFIFDSMLRKRELVEFTLSSLAAMLEENYITEAMYDRLAESLAPLMKEHAYAAVQVISKVREPHLDFFRLYFQVHSNVALPEDLLKRFKNLGYCWLVRAFSLVQKDLPGFQSTIYAKFYPDQLPRLAKPEEEEGKVRHYVGLVLGQMIDSIEQDVEGKAKGGKYGRCFVCKNIADYYCKDTKVPVCGVECKKAHLELLTKTNSLGRQYSSSFREAIEQLLIGNLQRKQSPALSIDFLVAIYSFSDYVPQFGLPHTKVLCLPVIYERIWMLYLSHSSKKGELCQHILASCLSLTDQFSRNMATQYFIALAADSRFLTVFSSFDRNGSQRLIDYVLRMIDEDRRADFLQPLLNMLFNCFVPNSFTYEFKQLGLVRSFNHDKDLKKEALVQLFGEDPYKQLISLIFRNELAINREKLGEYLYSNEELLREFLREIVRRKEGAPVDEILREVFYFINVKISDKIYRLFQILTEVYHPQPPFNQTNFFTYLYFVIMVVTELNNPAVTNKPTLSAVVGRVEQFSVDLAKNHREVIEGMFERVSSFPFSQQTRGILTHYPTVFMQSAEGVRPEEVIIENHELIYEAIIGANPEVTTLYRICSLVVNHPAICQIFLQLMVDKLVEEPRDEFLVQAISIIIELQPNAAGYLWRQILQDRQNGQRNQENTFRLSLIVGATVKLTDGNLKQLVRELCQMVPITESIDHYQALLSINRHRVTLIAPLLLANYQKCDNNYLKLSFIKKLGQFLQYNNEDNLNQLLLKMLQGILILPITQNLFVQAVLSIRFQRINNNLPFWTVLGKKCLEITNEKCVQLLQGYMKKGGEGFYESYLIQKTLNCGKEEHISLEILHNLQKLEPYIHQINRELLRLFILQQNLQIIMKYFDCFCGFNKSYELLLHKWNKDPTWITQEIKVNILKNIETLLGQQSCKSTVLRLTHLPEMIVRFVGEEPHAMVLVKKYIKMFSFKEERVNPQEGIMKTSLFNEFAEELSRKVQSIVAKSRNNGLDETIRAFLLQVVDVLHEMHTEARSLQTNIFLRSEMRKLLKILKPQANLPSLLTSSLLTIRSIFSLQDVIQHPNQPSLMRIFHQVEEVLMRQAQLFLSFVESGAKKDSLQRLCISQANNDAIKYGQVAIDIADFYLKSKGDLSSKDKSTMKRMLISIMMQGYFNQETGCFQSLSGSNLAQRIEEIFLLLK